MKLLIHRCHRWGKYERRKEHQQTSNGTTCRNNENCNAPITANHSWLWYKGHCSITQPHCLKKTSGWNIVIYTPSDYTIIGAMLNPYLLILHGLAVSLYCNTEESLTKHSQPFMIWWNSVPILLTTPSLTFHLWSSENQIVGFRSRSRRINQSQCTFTSF